MSTETTPEYSPGLAGVIAGETAICWVDPNAGLMYRGYDIHEMAQQASFEEVAYLLLNGELPDMKQLAQFRQQVAAERDLPGPVVQMLRLMPRSTHPMDMLRTGVSMLSAFDSDLGDNSHAANIRKSIRLIAGVSTLITDGWRISHGDEPLPEKPDLTRLPEGFQLTPIPMKAGDLVNYVAQQVGGKGGGRPDMAQAGGTNPGALAGALQSVRSWVEQRV